MTDTTQKYLALRLKNLEFFKLNYPGIYEFFSTYQMTQARVDILPEQDEVDIIINGQHMYGGKSTDYAKQEVATFLSVYDYGSELKTIRLMSKEAYKNSRFFAHLMSNIQTHYYQSYSGVSSKSYTLDNFLPLVVVMGVGLGKHIEVLSKTRDISQMILFENDMDKFSASLYVTDWQKIVEHYRSKPGGNFTFLLANNAKNLHDNYAVLWNELIRRTPHFPVTTLFYNHKSDPLFDQITSQVNHDLYVHLFSFGNFDDELNQLNNALHNLRAGVPLLPSIALHGQSQKVCVVGSGPSLDERIADLKRMQDKCLIISAGTAIRVLWKNGIKPDYHVELESDYSTYQLQSMIQDKAYFKDITLLGAAQLNPNFLDLFSSKYLFFKEDGSLARWFKAPTGVIENAAPTCTNAALAIVSYFGFDAVFLFGLDFGFADREKHHSESTVYYSSQTLQNQSDEKHAEIIEVEAAAGGSIWSTAFLRSSLRRVENHLIGAASKTYNCSDGARINGAEWLSSDSLSTYLQGQSESKILPEALNSSNSVVITKEQIEQAINTIQQDCATFIVDAMTLLQESELKTALDISQLCTKMQLRLSQLEIEDLAFYYFVRGSVWHFLLAGYTHVFSMTESSAQARYLEYWQEKFSLFLEGLQQRLSRVLFNTESYSVDEMANKAIWEALNSDISWLLSESDWEYQGYKVVNGRFNVDQHAFEYKGYSIKDNSVKP